jgi:predicted permease
MPWPQRLRLRLRALVRGRAADRDLDDELHGHLQYLTDEYIAQGMSHRDARDRALREFGGVVRLKEECREAHGVAWLTSAGQDLTYGLRLLRRTPGFTLAAIATLALGIGVNTAIFSLVDTVLLRVLPVERPDELVFIETAGTAGRNGAPGYPVFARIRDEVPSFSGAAAFATDELRVDVDGNIEQVYGQVVSGSFFDVLGLKPVAGRLMTAADESLDPPVAVIGYGYWQRRFGGSPDAIGKTITSGDSVFTIVGVTPASFRGLQPGRQIDVSLPITHARGMLPVVNASWFEAVARLRAGATVVAATAEADTIYQSFRQEGDRSNEMRQRRFARIQLSPASRGLDRLRERFGTPLAALALLAAIVLLMACANLGNLLMARGVGRAREFALRLAAGAAPGRLLRQLLTETMLLFLLGAMAGLMIAPLVIETLTAFFAIGRNPIVLDIQYNWRLAAFAGSVALGAALVTGVWPAVRAARTDVHAATTDQDARIAGSARLAAATRVLVAAQVSLSLVLLLTALMFVTTMVNLRAVDLGFAGRRVLTMSLDPLLTGAAVSAAREQFWTGVLERVGALPGVRAASLSVLTPLSGRDTGKNVTVPGFQPQSADDRSIHLNHVSEDYFRAFGIAIVEGRAFTPRDGEGSRKVVVINQAAAAAYFPGRSAIGETITFGKSDVYQIVGVARDYKHLTVRRAAPRFAFVALRQRLDPITRITLALDSDQPIAALMPAVTRAVQAVQPKTLISDVIGVEEQIAATLVSERLLSTLAAAFALLAVALAAIGLYGILSYSVARRRNEFGVRLALGERPAHLTASVFREVIAEVSAGMLLGVPIALLIARAAGTMLFGVAPTAPWIYLLGAATLASVAALAAWLPARRAANTDPITALRCE